VSIRDTELEERAARTRAALDEINAEYWGIPAATLAGLRDGSLVAVDKADLSLVMRYVDARYQSYERDPLDDAADSIMVTLAAARGRAG
jgi:hypothetical protein